METNKLFIRFAGGLGNQIFQLGAALIIAERHNCREIFYDCKDLDKYKRKAEFELDKIFDLSRSVRFKFSRADNLIFRLRIPKIISIRIMDQCFINDKNIKEYIYNIENNKKYYMDDYFQMILNQDNFKNEIRLLKEIIRNKDNNIKQGCIMHFRGGDFKKLGWDKVCSIDYYKKAVNLMINEYNVNKFYYITDDEQYANYIISNIGIENSNITNDVINDFYELGRYRYQILSASTFALWASVLGNKENKVIAPEYWRPWEKRKIMLRNEIRV